MRSKEWRRMTSFQAVTIIQVIGWSSLSYRSAKLSIQQNEFTKKKEDTIAQFSSLKTEAKAGAAQVDICKHLLKCISSEKVILLSPK